MCCDLGSSALLKRANKHNSRIPIEPGKTAFRSPKGREIHHHVARSAHKCAAFAVVMELASLYPLSGPTPGSVAYDSMSVNIPMTERA